VAGDPERLTLDALEHTRPEQDPFAGDIGQRPDGQRCALIVMEVPRAQLEHAPAVDVALAHQPPQIGQHPLRPVALARHHLQAEQTAAWGSWQGGAT
jgi:hypothetical protein